MIKCLECTTSYLLYLATLVSSKLFSFHLTFLNRNRRVRDIDGNFADWLYAQARSYASSKFSFNRFNWQNNSFPSKQTLNIIFRKRNGRGMREEKSKESLIKVELGPRSEISENNTGATDILVTKKCWKEEVRLESALACAQVSNLYCMHRWIGLTRLLRQRQQDLKVRTWLTWLYKNQITGSPDSNYSRL